MWKTLSKSDARKKFNMWEKGKIPQCSCDGEMLELRKKMIAANIRAQEFIKEHEKGTNRQDYLYDLRFGIEIYNLLNYEYGFKERHASNDEIWIYLSMNVIPDIVYDRWGLSDSRYYKQSRRIWLRIIWWYIHLSWNISITETYSILRGFTTDEIVQLVERSGPSGYRIDVTQEIMRQFSQIQSNNRNLFRRVMKLNTARLKLVEPALTVGGTKKYVEELISYFDETRRNNETKNIIKVASSS